MIPRPMSPVIMPSENCGRKSTAPTVGHRSKRPYNPINMRPRLTLKLILACCRVQGVAGLAPQTKRSSALYRKKPSYCCMLLLNRSQCCMYSINSGATDYGAGRWQQTTRYHNTGPMQYSYYGRAWQKETSTDSYILRSSIILRYYAYQCV